VIRFCLSDNDFDFFPEDRVPDVDVSLSGVIFEALAASLATTWFSAFTQLGQNQLCEEGTVFNGGLRQNV